MRIESERFGLFRVVAADGEILMAGCSWWAAVAVLERAG